MVHTTDEIVVDPQGQSMVVDIFDMNAVSITCYTARGGSSAFTLPTTITSATSFYLTAGGYYDVSAKLGGVEIAGVGGTKARVQAAQGVPVTVTPVIDQLEQLAAAASSTGGSVAASALYHNSNTPVGFVPPLTLVSGQRHDADGVFCELDGTTAGQINFLQDGIAAITVHGELYNTGTTGGTIAIQTDALTALGGSTIDAEGQADSSGEYDATVTLVCPVVAGESFTPRMAPRGATNEGNLINVLVTRVA